jgi:adenosylcobinamide-GDP ribazoletransferase
MKEQWEDFRIAAAFLTVFPVAGGLSMEPPRLARSMGLFPAVGVAIGFGLVIVNWALTPLVPRAVLDTLLILILIAATGALHLDGVADLASALAGGRSREEVLSLMQDGRVRAIGVVSLVMVLLLKYVSLHNVPGAAKVAALILMPAAGRWVQVVLASSCRYLQQSGERRNTGYIDLVGGRELLLATITLALAAILLLGFKGVLLLVLLSVAAAGQVGYLQRRLGGVNAIALGAATELTEVLSLLLILMIFRLSS